MRYIRAMTDSEDRLIKIETMLVHQDRQIQDLSEMINLQRKDTARLSNLLEKAQAEITDLQDAGRSGENGPLTAAQQAARDKPPHY